ncbi:hypothetical protein H6G25_03490 [Dolichospermum sp. FACHB-1091]|nr:hypothetical protein [Dolichospermum sp. FACHB-1091]
MNTIHQRRSFRHDRWLKEELGYSRRFLEEAIGSWEGETLGLRIDD